MNAGQRRPGWWYPHIFTAGFAVVIAVNAALVYFATSTFAGLETEGAYDKGLKYNQTLAAAEAQRALGWTATAEVGAVGLPAQGSGRTATLTVTLRDRHGGALGGLDVRAALTRPTIAGHDREVRLDHLGGGRYGATVDLPMPGQWDLRVDAAGAAGTYRLAKRVMLP